MAKIAERVTTPIGKMILDDLPNIPTGRETDDVSFYHAFDKIIQVLLRTRPHQHGFGLFAREQAIEILRWRVIRKIGLPVPILFYEILPKIVQIWDKYDSPLMTVHWTLITRTKHFSLEEQKFQKLDKYVFYDNCRSVDINYENKTFFFWGNKYFQKLDKYDSLR